MPFIINSFLCLSLGCRNLPFLWSKFLFHQGACLHALLLLLWAVEANCRESTLAHSPCFYRTELKTSPSQAPGRGFLISMPHFSVRKLKLSRRTTSGSNTQYIFILWVTEYYCLTSILHHQKKKKNHSETGIKVDGCFSSPMVALVINIHAVILVHC